MDGAGEEDAAKAEMLTRCEEQYNLMKKLQNEITMATTESSADDLTTQENVHRLIALTSEEGQWKELDPKLLPTNPEVLSAVGAEELQRINKELNMVLLCSQAKLESLKKLSEREKTWLEEKKSTLNAVTEKITTLQQEHEKSENSLLQDMKRKINSMKSYNSSLMEVLSDMFSEHFPLPEPQAGGASETELIPLSEIIERLTNRTLETPHEPYVTLDDAFWPPYVEMLLRNGVAVRHPQDFKKIRLENYF